MRHSEGRLSRTSFSLDLFFFHAKTSFHVFHYLSLDSDPPLPDGPGTAPGGCMAQSSLEEHRSISPSSGQPVAPARRSPNPGPEVP